eukprot:GILK01001132.1.p1 GENE.GILK01001132.1~~GILK01001132.1.p1  ORF type:complete len:787 (+),score=153.39 GILK01001132.1:47-2407(+)
MADSKSLFVSIGLEPKVVDNTLKNAAVTQNLVDTINEAGVQNGCPKSMGNLLYNAATRLTGSLQRNRKIVAEYIGQEKIRTLAQFDASVEFLKRLGLADLEVSSFEHATGVGVVVTPDEIREVADALLEARRTQLMEERYMFSTGELLRALREKLPWADGKEANTIMTERIRNFLGPETDADREAKSKPRKKVAAAAVAVASAVVECSGESKETEKLSTCIGRDMVAAVNPPHVLDKHRAATGGRIQTRFPPEPNGYLHIGHAKAMRFSFRVAEESQGVTYLRYDDTNPDKETVEYIENIEKNVRWLGYTPWTITYSSDYFGQLYEFAVALIRKGKAYVDESTPEQMHEDRRNKTNSKYRNRSVEENLRLFEHMRQGRFEEGTATLRLKIDMENPNPTMRDPVAYRIKYTAHPHCGDKWCIYPTYDYTHCLVDSLENITHSLCTLEFEIRRDLYYWILEALDMYRPSVWEFSRLNISNTVLSKRKLHHLVHAGIVNGWDDPRILTLNGLKRRGYTPEAINLFCDEVGVTRRGNENVLSIGLLEHCCRTVLDNTAPRTMVVLNPLRVTLINYNDRPVTMIAVPDFPKTVKSPARGSHSIGFGPVIYIDRDDFRLEDSKDFFGLAPGKEVNLKWCFNIKAESIDRDEQGNVVNINASIDFSGVNVTDNNGLSSIAHTEQAKKLKGHLHWVAEHTSTLAELRLYDTLFKSEFPNAMDNWLDDINPESLVLVHNARIDKYLAQCAKVGDKFQFERVGYFSVDDDFTVSRPVFNRTVTLKESKTIKDGKKA